MHPMLNIAIRAARGAGNIISRAFDRRETLTIETKRSNDYVTEVDRAAEQEIIKTLRKAYPSHAILAEESGATAGRDEEFQWIIDPLDGTTNFLHGLPQFAVSVALKFRGRLDQAVIYDPISQELFTASRGEGAQLNGKRIRVTPLKGLDGALLGTGFPYRDFTHMDAYMQMFRALATSSAGVRRPGSAALDLAYVAAGRYDGFWELGLNAWDLAAGALLVQEAGGYVSDFVGGDNYLESGNIVAAGPKVHAAMLKTIEPALTTDLRR